VYDFAVIGSGVSGGRIAHELTKQGGRCILLEAGKAYQNNTFPNNEMDYSTKLFWGGGLEISTNGSLGFLRAKCLGGTSIVNQALLDRFDSLVWDEWSSRSNISFFNKKTLEPFYQKVENDLSIQSIPKEHWNENAKKFINGFDNLGYQWSPLKRAQKECRLDKGSDCIVCLGGCPRDSKQSSLVTSIKQGLSHGLNVETEFEVSHIKSNSNSVTVFGNQNGEKKTITCSKLVLAGGAMGNSKILLRSKLKNVNTVGENFSCHPQFMTFAFFDEPINAHKGAFQSVKSTDQSFRKAGYKFENVFAPPIGTSMLFSGIRKKHQNYMKKYKHLASLEICVKDEPNGKITLDKNGNLKVKKEITQQDKRRIKHGFSVIEDLYGSLGAKHLFQSTQGFGLHLMGGCQIGTNPKTSVINPEFKLHEHPLIYAADSSIFPSAPGINPSLTIMALSEKAAEQIIKDS